MGFSFYIADPVKDRGVILKLWKENIQVDNPEERYAWLYHNNPAGPMRTVLAVHDQSDEVVGAGSLYPQKASLFGQSVVMGTAADYMVDKRFRVFGPALQIQRKLLESASDFGFDCLFGYPNQAAKGVIKRIGYKPIGLAHRYVKPLKTRDLLVSRIKSAALSAPLAKGLDSLLWCEDYLKSAVYKFKYRSISTDTVEKNGINFSSAAFPGSRIIFDKSQDKLAWRYAQKKFRFFSISLKADTQSKAIIVYQITDRVVSIIDIFSTDDKYLEPLLKLFISDMYKTNQQRISVQFLGDRFLIGLLQNLRFHRRDSDRHCYLYDNVNLSGAREDEMLDESNWFIFESDMDI